LKQTLLIITSLLSLNLIAQKRSTQFSIAAESAVMATSQAFQVYNLGFGGSAKVLFPTKKNNYFTGTLGVLSFSGRSGKINDVLNIPSSSIPTVYLSALSQYNFAPPSLTVLPIKAGYKYFLNKKFNSEFEVGYTAAFVKKVYDSYPGNIGGYTFALGFGFLVAKKIDIGMRYELFESTASNTNYTSYVGLRTMLMLDFKK
jgi:hypothetical protein